LKKIVKQKTHSNVQNSVAREGAPSSTLARNARAGSLALASPILRMRERRMNTGYFSIHKTRPMKASCHACAIVPGRRLLRPHQRSPNN